MKYVCDVCGWEYDEEVGYPEGDIEPGTKWEDVPEDFVCPLCMVGKISFPRHRFRVDIFRVKSKVWEARLSIPCFFCLFTVIFHICFG